MRACVRVRVCVFVVVIYLWNFLKGLQSQVDVKLILAYDICMVVTNDIKRQPELNTLRTGEGGGHLNCLNARSRGF